MISAFLKVFDYIDDYIGKVIMITSDYGEFVSCPNISY